ncbi:glutaredoxin family protein [Lysinibacillus endophyticus]|uniref:Glutaredoxin family protein n=1 Tax=Ureibacillus endophyticus TaxID=1978490 RepID=A0A494Z2S1_9BACL|nr:glutaredoxin family protein [Lysinibacillus endophyticus]MCP1145816.1 glutaredoxin family protein [Lysinibacillus endophyticus]RKQ16726.1 glutaredoxin family protein [Lysinibacillus endophyticus]
MKVTFYSRPNCPLCTDGLMMLKLVQEDVEFEIEMVNIEDDDEIHEKYMLMIPVVEKDGEIVQYGNLDYVTLLESLQ